MIDDSREYTETDVTRMRDGDYVFLHRPLKDALYSLIPPGLGAKKQVNTMMEIVLHGFGLYPDQYVECPYVHMLIINRVVEVLLLEYITVQLRTCERMKRDTIGVTKLLYITCKSVRAPPSQCFRI